LDLDGTIHAYAGTGETGYTGDGGPAVAATLVRPYDAQIGPDGSIFIADTGNHVIRRIDEAGVISTVVGVGVSGFGGDGGPASGCLLNGPSSVTFDDEGAMWIADTFNHRVRRVADAMSLIESPSTELEGESRETVANKDWERIKIGSE
jgi:serine/threonine-protein kinase